MLQHGQLCACEFNALFQSINAKMHQYATDRVAIRYPLVITANAMPSFPCLVLPDMIQATLARTETPSLQIVFPKQGPSALVIQHCADLQDARNLPIFHYCNNRLRSTCKVLVER